jgi:uncharacterized membrane protein
MAFTKNVKRYFFRGLAVLLPTMLTIWLVLWAYSFINENIGIYINKGIAWIHMAILGTFSEASKESIEKFWVHGIGSLAGFIISIILVCTMGIILASVIGRAFWKGFEGLILKAPILRHIYPHVKQVTDFIFSEEDQKKIFSRVVLVEFPRKGLWSLAFVTNSSFKKIDNQEREIYNILIPTAPSPVTGFLMFVPKEDVQETGLSVEEAIKFVVSAGVISPLSNSDFDFGKCFQK